MEPSPAQRAARDRIAAQLAQAGFALPGTLTVRAYACGKPGCRCHADPPRLHGPYAEWTRKIGGKTITRRLTPRQLAEYQPLFDNAKKLRTLLSELQDLTLQIIETGTTREPSTPAEPEPAAPENVGEARLTCGQPSSQTPFAQVNPKREDHSTGINLQGQVRSSLDSSHPTRRMGAVAVLGGIWEIAFCASPSGGTSGAGHGQRLQCRAGRGRAPCRRRVFEHLGSAPGSTPLRGGRSGRGHGPDGGAVQTGHRPADRGLQLAEQRPGHFSSFWPADGIWAKTMRSVGRGAQPPRLLLGRSP